MIAIRLTLYLLIGVVYYLWYMGLDAIKAEEHSNGFMLYVILFWPIAMVAFIFGFIKGYIDAKKKK